MRGDVLLVRVEVIERADDSVWRLRTEEDAGRRGVIEAANRFRCGTAPERDDRRTTALRAV